MTRERSSLHDDSARGAEEKPRTGRPAIAAFDGEAAREALRIDANGRTTLADHVVQETAIAFQYNGTPHAVMMATPRDLPDFALGFTLNERIVEAPSDVELVDVLARDGGIVLEIAIPARAFETLQERRRGIVGRSGCGLCGVETLQQAIAPIPRVRDALVVSAAQIAEGFERLAAAQPLNARTGGVHAAAHVGQTSILVREDVGRHNALDKLAGALVRERQENGFVAVTSRASYELVHKAATMGVELLAAISAPTTLAIELADSAGLTLVAFARGEAMNVYTHAHRVR